MTVRGSDDIIGSGHWGRIVDKWERGDRKTDKDRVKIES